MSATIFPASLRPSITRMGASDARSLPSTELPIATWFQFATAVAAKIWSPVSRAPSTCEPRFISGLSIDDHDEDLGSGVELLRHHLLLRRSGGRLATLEFSNEIADRFADRRLRVGIVQKVWPLNHAEQCPAGVEHQ